MALGVVGILYGAVLAFGQTDLKRLVAYTSISHMGFVLLGIFAWNALALQGRRRSHGRARRQHRRAVHPGRPASRAHAHARHGPDGRAVGDGAAAGRGHAVLRAGVAGAAGAGQFRRRVPGAAGVLSGQHRARGRRGAGPGGGGHLCAVDRPARFPRAEPGRLAIRRPDAARDVIAGALAAAVLWIGLYPAPLLRTVGPALQQSAAASARDKSARARAGRGEGAEVRAGRRALAPQSPKRHAAEETP